MGLRMAPDPDSQAVPEELPCQIDRRPAARLACAWIGLIARAPLPLVLITLLAAVGTLTYVADNLGVDTDTAGMLSHDLPFWQDYDRYRTLFPQYNDTLLVVIDGAIPEQARAARDRLAALLRREPDLFPDVYVPGDGEFFARNALLYSSLPQLDDLADQLAQIQPFLGRLVRNPSLYGLLDMLSEATRAVQEGRAHIDLGPVYARLSEAIAAVLDGRHYRLSWQNLIRGETSGPEDRRQFIVVKPRLRFDEVLAAAEPVKRLRELAHALQLSSDPGLRIRLTGDVALAHEELESVITGARIAGLLALVSVVAVLIAGLRSLYLVAVTFITLLVGLIFTAGFATVAIGHLNLISVAFAVMYIGLGVDYAIHLLLRYQELRGQGMSTRYALQQTTLGVGGSLVLCATTTALGFFAFVPTAYAGVAELGLISGTGMFISLLVTLVLLPAFLCLRGEAGVGETRIRGEAAWRYALVTLPCRHRRTVLAIAALLGLAGLALLSQLRFDTDPLNLRDPHSESVATFRELQQSDSFRPWTAVVLRPGREQATAVAAQLEALPQVDEARTLLSFVPEDQEAKLALIDEMALILGPELESDLGAPHGGDPVLAVQNFRARLDVDATEGTGSVLPAEAGILRDRLQRFTERLQASSGHEEPQRLWHTLEDSLLATFPQSLNRLRQALEAGPVTEDDLPPELAVRWRSPTGIYRVEALPAENLDQPAALDRFVAAMHGVDPHATGVTILNRAAGQAIAASFRQALAYAFLAITLLLLLLLRSIRAMLLVLVPLLLAGVLTAASTVLLDMPFNFANVIALPLLLGIGVDNGIHFVHRANTAPPGHGRLLQTSTARAIFFSALTTIFSFGNLLFSPHRGTASMGSLLAIGVTLTLVATMFVLPALLSPREPAPENAA